MAQARDACRHDEIEARTYRVIRAEAGHWRANVGMDVEGGGERTVRDRGEFRRRPSGTPAGRRIGAARRQVRLAPEECVRLLDRRSIGRVVFTDNALPAIQPVTFCLDEDVIVVRTGTSSRLGIAAPGSVVGFEVDDIEPDSMAGWAVTAIGQAEIVTDALEIARLGALSLPAWRNDGPSRFLRIRPRMLRGERTMALTTAAS
jgi:uncharacterized protein